MTATKTDVISVRAQARWVRMSARKARIVLEHVRGRTVPEARTVLAFTPRAAAVEIDRVLRSAVANAESVHALDGDELRITEAFADEGPTLKRWQPRARGRVNRIRKRTCHITIILEPDPKAVGRPRRGQKTSKQEIQAPDSASVDAGALAGAAAETAAEKPKRRSPEKKKEAAV